MKFCIVKEREMKFCIVCIVTIFTVFGGNALGERDFSEEDLVLETELKAINKPAAKAIQTETGETYDCVDIYKQPSLDHPLLKDHAVQMRPSAALEKTLKASRTTYLSSADQIHPVNIGLEDGCPSGTVPIRRLSKGDLLRSKSSFTELDFSVHAGEGVQHYAGVATKTGSPKPYHGAGARLNIYSPTIANDQMSSAIIMVWSGTPGRRGGIRTGWMASSSHSICHAPNPHQGHDRLSTLRACNPGS